ncbi:hematopoietic prostaglandin D synthase-like [Amphiura filiformis]|uniref:hematopoietic prostaglandin D synthase-like n=1 Tax=Amphiura filiformis TaxID=82378 RepID=UPI003B21A20B
MPKYKLTYMNFRARAEPARMLFFMKGVEFEDIIIEDGKWLDVKHTFPLGQVPVLEVDDVIITQTRPLTRYLGREFGYYGKTNLEAAQIDSVMDVCDDIHIAARPIYRYQGAGEFDPKKYEVENAEVLKEYREVVVPGFLSQLQTLFLMNKNDDGYFVGKEITIADLYYFATFDYVEIYKKDMFAGFPKMAALYKKIMAHDKVAEYLKKTDYGNNPMDKYK